MPNDFDKNLTQGFGRSFCNARNLNGQISTSVLVAAVPFQGYGYRFSSGSKIGFTTSPPVPNAATMYLDGGYDTSTTGFYQTLKIETWLVDYPTWNYSITTSYKNYFINGYGNSSLGPAVSVNNQPPGSLSAISIVSETYTETELTTIINGQGIFSPPSGSVIVNGNAVLKMTLSDYITREEATLAAMTLLDSVETPALESSAGSSTGKKKLSIVWPDSASTYATRTNSGDLYMICAANGMLTTGATSLDGGSIASKITTPSVSLGFSNQSIICAKSKWLLRNKAFDGGTGKPKAPWQLYHHPLDSSFVPQSVASLSRTLGYSLHEFTPSDIPPNGFTPPYNPPYTPKGYGEIGFESST